MQQRISKMDLTKLQGSSFNESGLFGSSSKPEESSIEKFLSDTNQGKMTASVGDLLSATRSRHGRQFTEERRVASSASTPALGGVTGPSAPPSANGSPTKGKKALKDKLGASRGKATDDRLNVIERPANRVDIAKLERELEVRVQAIVSEYINMDDPSELADPRKDGMVIIRDQVLAAFGADIERLQREPWLDTLIKCECVKITCDDIAKKLTDMLSVTSTELGNVLRKLRIAYQQAFDQMRASWQQLRSTFVEYETELLSDRQTMRLLQDRLSGHEDGVRAEMQEEIDRMTSSFNAERLASKEALDESEFKMAQMGETLESLNDIFKNMQNDGQTVRISDLTSKCQRLERENTELGNKGMMVDKLKNDLEVALEKINTLERENKSKDMELTVLNQQLVRREETVTALMERETLRNAEIEKMKDITGVDDGVELDVTMAEPATSVLCIKCKKSLDDLSNIRAAILNKSDKSKLQCENYRILLPNLRGRRPNRSQEWIRSCMRSILVSKMREDVTLLDINGESSTFSSYVYAWFARVSDYMEGGNEAKSQQEADEDRWGLYYGVKAMAKDKDPEATIFWTLLEETHGEDGMHFVFHCLSMALAMGGHELWKQFGETLTTKSVGISMQANEKPSIRHNIWIDVGTAVDALKAILVRALKPHVKEAVEAVYAFRELPAVSDPQMANEDDTDATATADALGGENALAATESAVDDGNGEEKEEGEGDGETAVEDREPTHVNLFVWIRLLLQQMQAEQIHRGAAVRLMCESASVGALTPQLSSTGDADDLGSTGSQVEYPQFQLISKTLFPNISALDTAALYIHCYDEGRRKVTADVLLKVADRRGLFSKSMRLTTLPLLQHDVKEFDVVEAVRLMEEEKRAELGELDEEDEGEAKEEGEAPAPMGEPQSAAEPGADDTPEKESKAEGAEGEVADDATAATADTKKSLKPGEKVVSPEEQARQEEAAVKKDAEQRLRSQLGVLIHRKVAALMPDYELLIQRVPTRWRGLLASARENVIMSLDDAYDKMRRVRMETRDEAAKQTKVDHYIDGIQPFVQYRRLLSMMLMVKTFSENPLLPSELFLGKTGTVLPNFNFGFKHVEDVLGSLEKGIVTGLRLDCVNHTKESTTRNLVHTTVISEKLARQYYGDLGTSKLYRYEAARRNICARRLQNWCLHHFSSYITAIPASIRQHMKPGYIRRSPGVGGVRDRQVLRAPWWAQSLVSEIYSFKFEYDQRAGQLGQKPLDLGEAAAACCYKKYNGVTAVSERVLQDLCWNIRAHSRFSSRLKLFSAFAGFADAPINTDNEENAHEPSAQEVLDSLVDEAHLADNLMKSPIAVAVYLNLICEVHREVATAANPMPTTGDGEGEGDGAGEPGAFLKKVGILSGEEEAAPAPVEESKKEVNPLLAQPAAVAEGDVTAADSLDDINTGVAPSASSDSQDAKKSPLDLNLIKPALLFVPEIEALLPSSTTGDKSRDESDTWLLDADVLKRAVTRWSLCIQGIDDEARSGFSDLVEAVRATSNDPLGRLNVDDFLWVTMQQWVKHIEYSLKKTAAKAALAIKNSLEHAVPIGLRLVTDQGQPTVAASTSNEGAHQTTGNAEHDLEVSNLKLPSALRVAATKKRVPAWTLRHIKETAESIYKANDGTMPRLPDLNKASVTYLTSIRTGTLRAHCLDVVTKTFREMTVWDCNCGTASMTENGPVATGYSYQPAVLLSIGKISRSNHVEHERMNAKLMVADYIHPIAEFIKERERFLKGSDESSKKYNPVLKKRLHKIKELYKRLHTVVQSKSLAEGDIDNVTEHFSIFKELIEKIDDVLNLAVQIEAHPSFIDGQAEYPVDDNTHTKWVRDELLDPLDVYQISLKHVST